MLSGSILLEADTVYVNGGKVCASFMNDLSKTSIGAFETLSLKWVWKLCCTDRTQETVGYNIGETTKSNSTTNVAMVWFKDMKDWDKVLSVNSAGGAVLLGSKPGLISAIRKGSEIQMKILYILDIPYIVKLTT